MRIPVAAADSAESVPLLDALAFLVRMTDVARLSLEVIHVDCHCTRFDLSETEIHQAESR